MIDDHIENRENPEKVVAWLNEFQPVQAVLAAEFNHSPITVEDLELWRKFRESETQPPGDLTTVCTAAVESAKRISAAGLNADILLTLVSARVAASLDQLDWAENHPEENARLKLLMHGVIAIHQCETRSARLALDRERLAHERDKHREKRESARRKGKPENREPSLESQPQDRPEPVPPRSTPQTPPPQPGLSSFQLPLSLLPTPPSPMAPESPNFAG